MTAFGTLASRNVYPSGGAFTDQFGADIAGGTRPVLDLAKPLRERLADQACSDVTPAAKPAMMRTGRVG